MPGLVGRVSHVGRSDVEAEKMKRRDSPRRAGLPLEAFVHFALGTRKIRRRIRARGRVGGCGEAVSRMRWHVAADGEPVGNLRFAADLGKEPEMRRHEVARGESEAAGTAESLRRRFYMQLLEQEIAVGKNT